MKQELKIYPYKRKKNNIKTFIIFEDINKYKLNNPDENFISILMVIGIIMDIDYI